MEISVSNTTPAVALAFARPAKNNDWHTPPKYIEMARRVLGEIDLDPASSFSAQKTVKAKQFFTRALDGLSQEWRGRIWLNPPHGRGLIAPFIDKLVDEYKKGNVTSAIMLTQNSTDTGWFHTAFKAETLLCFPRGRIYFTDPDGNRAAQVQGQAFHYFGNDPNSFAREFGEIGIILKRLEKRLAA